MDASISLRAARARSAPTDDIGLFKGYLPVWVALAMGGGLLAGWAAPGAFSRLAFFEVGHVNLLIAGLVWLMILPSMIQVDYTSIARFDDRSWRRGLLITVTTNWLVKPFTMALLAGFFTTVVFRSLIPVDAAPHYAAGLILLGAAPCTGMVFVWSRLTRGSADFTVVQVAINNLILLFAFAPLVAFLLHVGSVSIPWQTLTISTAIFVVLPLLLGASIRRSILAKADEAAVHAFASRFAPLTSSGLLLLVFSLFALQSESILRQPLAVCLISVPLLIQTYAIFAFAYLWARASDLPQKIAAPAALIGTSNFFELAIAVAIALFGADSPAALATTVGVLVEVPVMLSLVAIANRTARVPTLKKKNFFTTEAQRHGEE